MTEYDRWFRSDKPYQVGWTKDYEPWFIVDRFLNPFYDSVFRGYGAQAGVGVGGGSMLQGGARRLVRGRLVAVPLVRTHAHATHTHTNTHALQAGTR